MKEISIKDIAKMAGVVPSTVSLVLNGKARQMRISDLLAERIKKIAHEAGYKPNQVAVSLRTGSSKLIGLIIEDISNIFFANMAKVIEDEVQKYGYRVVFCSTDNNALKGNDLINALFQRQMDGYLIAPAAGMEKQVGNLMKNNQPLVLIDRYFPNLPVSYVMSDNINGTSEAMEFLIKKGYQNIGLVTSDFPVMHPQQRETAYTNVLNKYNMAVKHEYIYKVPYTSLQHEATHHISDFLKSTPQLDAIFFTTNYLGIYGLSSIKQLGLRIPQDIAVICFDDHDIFKLHTPTITAVEQNIENIAKKATELLMHQIEKNIAEKEMNIVMPTNLIVRESA